MAEDSVRFANDAVAKALEEVAYYTAKIREDFTGDEPQFRIFKDRVQKASKEVEDYNGKIKEFVFKEGFTGDEPQFKIVNELLRTAKAELDQARAELKVEQNAELNAELKAELKAELEKANERLDKAKAERKAELEKANEHLIKVKPELKAELNAELDKANERLEKAKAELKAELAWKQLFLANVNDPGELRKLATKRVEEGEKRLRMMHPDGQVPATNATSTRKSDRPLENYVHKQSSSKSYSEAELGQQVLARLKGNKALVNATIIESEDAFWSKENQKTANSKKTEAELVAFITPFFNKVLTTCDLVFVNSEQYGWLSQSESQSRLASNTDFKPDGFATHRGMYRTIYKPDTFRFGVAEQGLLDCLILFECKLKISDATAFGQVVRYLQHLCPNESVGAILFDPNSFWLIESSEGSVTRVVTAKWVDKGSGPLFVNFITNNKSPWITCLTHACNSLRVDVEEGEAFLGKGAFGRVFKVKRGEEILALKVVLGKDKVQRLHQEENALLTAQDTKLAIRVIHKVIEFPGFVGAALLLSPVGTPLRRPKTSPEVTILFNLLWQLHEKNRIHGDPRVPNVILHEDQYLWIDLFESQNASPCMRATDAEILTRSILNCHPPAFLDKKLLELIDKYGDDATKENLNNLIAKVWISLSTQLRKQLERNFNLP